MVGLIDIVVLFAGIRQIVGSFLPPGHQVFAENCKLFTLTNAVELKSGSVQQHRDFYTLLDQRWLLTSPSL
jgi:hypothetical protein